MEKAEKKRKNWRKSKDFGELKDSLRESLERRGLTERVYADKLEEYMEKNGMNGEDE